MATQRTKREVQFQILAESLNYRGLVCIASTFLTFHSKTWFTYHTQFVLFYVWFLLSSIINSITSFIFRVNWSPHFLESESSSHKQHCPLRAQAPASCNCSFHLFPVQTCWTLENLSIICIKVKWVMSICKLCGSVSKLFHIFCA